jgi:tetratricopeptide (TPR) repeat protein
VSLRRSAPGRGVASSPRRSSPEALSEEREFLRRSMDDLDEERALGDVDEGDFELLRDRYRRRLSEVETAISDHAGDAARADDAADSGSNAHADAADDAAGSGSDAQEAQADSGGPLRARSRSQAPRLRRRLGNRRVRRVLVIAAALCFVVAAGLLAASLAGVRLPGESATGSVTLSSAQQEQETLDQAAILGSEGQIARAVQLYNEVLRVDPNQPNALTYEGWLVRLAGLSSKDRAVLARGDASVARAVKVAPGYPDAHALMGVILYEDLAEPSAAVAQFRHALAVGASKSLVASVAPVAAKAFAAAKMPLPTSYASALKSAAG